MTRLASAAAIELKKKELVSEAIVAAARGDTIEVHRIYKQYMSAYLKYSPKPTRKQIASFTRVGINVEKRVAFKLTISSHIFIKGVGEMCSTDGQSWCDYGWITDVNGKMVWQMQGKKSTAAGGAQKNRAVQDTIHLPAGKYFLHYKSDGGHAFNSWDDLPPDDFQWGIRLYVK